ncbi:MAG: M48 family metallopeptidase [bacterium]|nr:M48 family metallopeptidase [bacterium]
MNKVTKKRKEPVTLEFEGIPFEVIRRRVKYSRVEFKTSGLRVIVPRGIKPRSVLEENKEPILRKYHKLMGQMRASEETPIVERSHTEFETLVSYYVHRYSKQLNVKIPQIKYRRMKRRWGSCRSDGIVTLNRCLQYVPENLVAYIIYHELAHFIIRGHNRDFKSIVSIEFPNYRSLDKELTLYGIKLLE